MTGGKDVQPAQSALDEIRQWNLKTFNRKAVGIVSGSEQREWSWLAHELQAISPDAVTGAKDALTEDGDIQPQTLNTITIIARLARAVQELEERLTALGG